MKPAILSEADIAQRANEVLMAYERVTGRPITSPVPIEEVALQVLDLSVEYDFLPTLPGGRLAVSMLRQPRFGMPASIIVNEDALGTVLRDCPGLERTAIAHEAGHGTLHIDRGRIHQLDFGFD